MVDLTASSGYTPAFTTGKFGQALTNASTGLQGYYATGNFGGGAPPYTLEAWVKTTATALQVIFGDGSATWLGAQNGKLLASFSDSGTLTSTASINDGGWHHVAVTCDGTTQRIFVDGALDGSRTSTAVIWSATGSSKGLGWHFGTTQYGWVGQIDEVRLSNVARYTAAFTPQAARFSYDTNTMSLWHLDGDGVADTTPAQNFSGSGTFTGAGALAASGVAQMPILASAGLAGAGTLSTVTSAVAPPAPPAGATPGIHVTPNPDAEPPRFEIELTTPDGSMIQTVTLLRTVNGVTTPTRVQPNTGSSYQYVEDYEEPWDTDVTYTATVTTGTGTNTYNASPYQLTSANAWAIHPLTPALSVCIDSPGATFGAAVTAVSKITRASNVTRHDILGSPRPIVTKVGNRSSSEGTMEVATLTVDVEDRLWTLVDDQTPLLIQFPPAWNTHFEFGYYDLGAVDADRFGKLRDEPVRLFTLPFLRVDAPAGTQQSAWTYAKLLHDFATYAAVTAAYANYPALLTDERR